MGKKYIRMYIKKYKGFSRYKIGCSRTNENKVINIPNKITKGKHVFNHKMN